MGAGLNVAGLERDVAAILRTVHLRTQVSRFLRLWATAFALSLTTGTSVWGWKLLASSGVGAVEVALRQMWPSLPIGTIIAKLKAAGKSTPTGPTAVPRTPPSPSAAAS